MRILIIGAALLGLTGCVKPLTWPEWLRPSPVAGEERRAPAPTAPSDRP